MNVHNWAALHGAERQIVGHVVTRLTCELKDLAETKPGIEEMVGAAIYLTGRAGDNVVGETFAVDGGLVAVSFGLALKPSQLRKWLALKKKRYSFRVTTGCWGWLGRWHSENVL